MLPEKTKMRDINSKMLAEEIIKTVALAMDMESFDKIAKLLSEKKSGERRCCNHNGRGGYL